MPLLAFWFQHPPQHLGRAFGLSIGLSRWGDRSHGATSRGCALGDEPRYRFRRRQSSATYKYAF
jgi:hypothetical protein